MPFVESDFKRAKFRFGGPSKFIEHVVHHKKTKDPIHLVGLAHSMFSSLHQMGFTKTNGTKAEPVAGHTGKLSEFAMSLAMPLLAKTAKEGAIALTIARDTNPVDSIRVLEPFLDRVVALRQNKAKKGKQSDKEIEKRGSFLSAVGCIYRDDDYPSFRKPEIEEIFNTFSRKYHNMSMVRNYMCSYGWMEELGSSDFSQGEKQKGNISKVLKGNL